jgi:hypothetical protein
LSSANRMKSVDARLEAAARRLRLALDLFEAGEELMRQQLRRKHPALAQAEIETRLLEWLRDRPGAEFGDAAGRPVPWPRPSR